MPQPLLCAGNKVIYGFSASCVAGKNETGVGKNETAENPANSIGNLVGEKRDSAMSFFVSLFPALASHVK